MSNMIRAGAAGLALLLLIGGAVSAEDEGAFHFEAQVVDQDEGTPLAGAQVRVRFPSGSVDGTTNQDGIAEVTIPEDAPSWLSVTATHSGYVSVTAPWEVYEGDAIPSSYVFPLPKGVTIGGVVVNEDGEPVEGVEIRLIPGRSELIEDERLRLASFVREPVAVTDAEGRWSFDGALPDMRDFSLRADHDDYLSNPVFDLRPPISELLAHEARFQVRRGLTARGKVMDPHGAPMEGVKVTARLQGMRGSQAQTETDADGLFVIHNLDDRRAELTAQHPEYAPYTMRVTAEAVAEELEITLPAPQIARLRVVDLDGNPVEGVRVRLDDWYGPWPYETSGAPPSTCADGRWEWRGAPAEQLTFNVSKDRLVAVEPPAFVPDGEEHVVTVREPLRVTGVIVNAETDAPVMGAEVYPVHVWESGNRFVARYRSKHAEDGTIEWEFERNDCEHALYVRAPGYRAHTTESFALGFEPGKSLRIALTPTAPVEGIVRDAEGLPLAGVDVVLCTPSQQVNLDDGRLASGWVFIHYTSDEDGRIEVDAQHEPYLLVVAGDPGYAEVSEEDFEAYGEIVVRPWARVEGVFLTGGEPVSEATVSTSPIRYRGQGSPLLVHYAMRTTDLKGRFTFDRVPPGPATVSVRLGPWEPSPLTAAPNAPLDLQPGETAHVALGGSGVTVTGRLVAADPQAAPDWRWGLNYLIRKEAPAVSLPAAALAEHAFDYRDGWDEAWQSSPEGRLYMATLWTAFVKADSDGAFRIPDLLPGDYALAFRIYDDPEGGCLTSPIATKSIEFTVSEMEDGAILDLGDVSMDTLPVIHPGDAAPGFAVERLEGGGEIRLSDFRGQYVLLDFWATWCAPCSAELPNLQNVAAKYGDRLAMISLSLDRDVEAARRYVANNNRSWPQGFLGDWSGTDVPQRYNVSAIPAIFLIDPDGNLAARHLRGPTLLSAVEEALGAM